MEKKYESEFEEFWRSFPRKVGKFAAQKVYAKVRRGGISQEELMDGIAQYIRTKPVYADYCHAKTWLSQGRWLDEPDVKPSAAGWTCPDLPPCPPGTTQYDCYKRSVLAAGRRARTV